MEANFIYFSSSTMQACFSGYPQVSQTIWLNFSKETNKCFKQQKYDLKLKIWSIPDEALIETIKMDIWNAWFGALARKLWHFENALGCKTEGSGFHRSDLNLGQDFRCI
jgi:hypothetical protein